MDDVTRKLDEIVGMIEGARAMPMSASCVVNRAELLTSLDELRALLPTEFRHAQFVLRDRDDVVDEGRREADRIVADARAERSRLITDTEVFRAAQERAEQLVVEATEQVASMRREIDDYVDGKLANFEVVLTKTLAAVERGRAKISGRHELDDLAGDSAESGSGT